MLEPEPDVHEVGQRADNVGKKRKRKNKNKTKKISSLAALFSSYFALFLFSPAF